MLSFLSNLKDFQRQYKLLNFAADFRSQPYKCNFPSLRILFLTDETVLEGKGVLSSD